MSTQDTKSNEEGSRTILYSSYLSGESDASMYSLKALFHSVRRQIRPNTVNPGVGVTAALLYSKSGDAPACSEKSDEQLPVSAQSTYRWPILTLLQAENPKSFDGIP